LVIWLAQTMGYMARTDIVIGRKEGARNGVIVRPCYTGEPFADFKLAVHVPFNAMTWISVLR
jgi:hypothetical protein